MTTDYEYDVALSYASEDRVYVERVAESLKQQNVRVFYDLFEQVNLWGKDLYVHLDQVYSVKARYCVLFLSTHYATKLWTSHERESAQARAFQSNSEYILPVRFDDTEIPGIKHTVGYIAIKDMPAEKLAKLICEKIRAAPNVSTISSVVDIGPTQTASDRKSRGHSPEFGLTFVRVLTLLTIAVVVVGSSLILTRNKGQVSAPKGSQPSSDKVKVTPYDNLYDSAHPDLVTSGSNHAASPIIIRSFGPKDLSLLRSLRGPYEYMHSCHNENSNIIIVLQAGMKLATESYKDIEFQDGFLYVTHDFGKPLTRLEGDFGFITCFDIASSAGLAAAGDWNGNVGVWDWPAGSKQLSFKPGKDAVMNLRFSSDGQELAVGQFDGRLYVCNSRLGSVLRQTGAHSAAISALSYSRDGSLIVTGGLDNAVRVWDASSLESKCVFDGHTSGITSAVFSKDSPHVYSSSLDKTIRQWDMLKHFEVKRWVLDNVITCLHMAREKGVNITSTKGVCTYFSTEPPKGVGDY